LSVDCQTRNPLDIDRLVYISMCILVMSSLLAADKASPSSDV